MKIALFGVFWKGVKFQVPGLRFQVALNLWLLNFNLSEGLRTPSEKLVRRAPDSFGETLNFELEIRL